MDRSDLGVGEVTDASVRLAEALKDRYTIERELRPGGMATVYRVEDRKHQRPLH